MNKCSNFNKALFFSSSLVALLANNALQANSTVNLLRTHDESTTLRPPSTDTKPRYPNVNTDYTQGSSRTMANSDESWDMIGATDLPVQNHTDPLVKQTAHGYVVASSFKAAQDDVKALVNFSYKKAKQLTEEGDSDDNEIAFPTRLSGKGWQQPKYFSGTRGEVANDTFAGFVTRKGHVVSVIIHGSANTADWITNALGSLTDPDQLPIQGRVHQGFRDKYSSFRTQMMEHLLSTFAEMTPEEKRLAKVIVSGHSQGGGLATLALADVVTQLKEVYGSSYDNTQENRVYGYLLAGARVGNATAAESIEALVGQDNIIRQATTHDLVPNAAPGRTINRFLRTLGLGDYADKVSGYHSVGHLALQHSLPTVLKGIRVTSATLQQRAQQGYFIPTVTAIRSVLSPLTFVKLAHLATDDPVNGGGFNPKLVEEDTANLLSQGAAHTKANAAHGEGVFQRVYHAAFDAVETLKATASYVSSNAVPALEAAVSSAKSVASSVLASASSALSHLSGWFR